MAEICRGGGGYNLGSVKQLLAIKVSFCINKPNFWELMSELVTFPFSEGRPFDVISRKIEQLFIKNFVLLPIL